MPPRLPDPLPTLAATSFAGALGLGVGLRWMLAGLPVPAWAGLDFGHLRSAHSHLAWYGLVFPLLWRAWAEAGGPRPGPLIGWSAAVGTALATVGFAHSGYNPLSITGSTLVLGAWLGWAARLAGGARWRSWEALPVAAVIASALAIPAVAVLTGRGDPLAGQLVQAFLGWLLLGVAAPAALAAGGAPPPPAALSLPLVLGAGLALGPLPAAGPLLGALGLLYAAAALRAPLPWGDQIAWALLGVGLLADGLGLLPTHPAVHLAGLHAAALGPVLVGLAWPARGAALRAPFLGLVGAFGLSIAGPAFVAHPLWPRLSFFFGALVAAGWLLAAAPARRPSPSPAATG